MKVARLFPFVLKARLLLVGGDQLHRSLGKLQFIWFSEDLSPNAREKLLSDFKAYPMVEAASSSDFEEWFGVRGAKVLGFRKASLSTSIYRELKEEYDGSCFHIPEASIRSRAEEGEK